MADLKRITSLADLQKIRQACKPLVTDRRKINGKARTGKKQFYIQICMGGGCLASGAAEIKKQLEAELTTRGLAGQVTLFETGCLGPCSLGPLVVIYPDGVLYGKLRVEDPGEIVQSHLLEGRLVERLIYQNPADKSPAPTLQDLDFTRRQQRIVLHNCGVINPEKLEEYIARDGYFALHKALTELDGTQIIAQLKASGLRGRGGAGFPTWFKWQLTHKAAGELKYVVCNADEGDPGAFMDRSLLEGDPHSLIEAMAIAGYTVGAARGYVYVRAEYPLAVERLTKAIHDAEASGLLGDKILGTDFNFHLEIRMGSGAFVCGEETALLTSIEGNRGEPRPRPPFPAQEGLWGKPTLLNNVETYVNIPSIILKGADWYAGHGSGQSKGTKIFALAGAVNTTGLVEIPIGTPLGEIVYDIGGGIPGEKKYKAAQLGGPSGGCIPTQHLNVAVDYESLTELGAIMGSGGLIVMDEDTCMVDVARYFLEFVQEESCGKCVPCRVGTKRMLEILERICRGEGQEEDLDTLQVLGSQIRDTALCGLGQTAANPVLSTIRYFRDEYLQHIRHKRCPAGVCPELVVSPCQNGCPAGVNVPGFLSLIGEKRIEEAIKLHRERNPFVAVCAAACFHPCESKCRRAAIDQPLAIKNIKHFMAEQEDELIFPTIRGEAANGEHKIAIAGAGPAGLACAYFLCRLGYRPVIFEAESEPGGMLIQGIPAYRLPRHKLMKEIAMIKAMGTEIITGSRLGRDFTLQSLKEEGYQAVFLAMGAPKGLIPNMPGCDAGGVTDAIDFLRSYNLTGKATAGSQVIIIGGGNAAVDAARTALRLGATTATILYRRTAGEMPAYQEEVAEAVKEGVIFEFLTAPTEILSQAGRVTGVQCSRMQLGAFDKSGRRRPEPRPGQLVTFPADQIIFAVGQQLDSTAFNGEPPPALKADHYLQVDDKTGQTSLPLVFAGGDVVSGPASIIEAVAGGERAAFGIDLALSGSDHAFWRQYTAVDTYFDPEADPVIYPRQSANLLAVELREHNFREVEIPWDEQTTLKEVKRCLRCDYRL